MIKLILVLFENPHEKNWLRKNSSYQCKMYMQRKEMNYQSIFLDQNYIMYNYT